MYTINKINILNYLISLIPLSLIIGNLIVNINIFLICVLGFIIYGKEIFFIKKKNYQFLIYIFFFYLIFITFLNNFPNFRLDYFAGSNNLNIYEKNFLKSVFFIRFLFLFFIINKLIETNYLNLKIFFISASFFSLAISIDLIIQVIAEKNILGYSILAGRPSSFFGDENIAGGYLQKFILFFIFLIGYKTKKKYVVLILFLLFFIPIIMTGNRMPGLIYFIIFLAYFFLEKKIKFIFFSSIFSIVIIFSLIKYPTMWRLDDQLKAFAKDSSEIILKIPKIFISNYDNSLKYGSSGYLIHFNTAIKIWKEDKFFGKGLKSFPINCSYGEQTTCNNHPHNYFLEILLDTGIIGGIFIYSIFFFGLINFIKLYPLIISTNKRYFLYPFFFITLFEFFPIRSSGSFFTTSNSTVIFLMLAIFINLDKIKNYKL